MDLSPAIIGLLIGIPSFILGMLGYWRAVKIDRRTEDQMLITARASEVTQVLDGQNKIIANLQDDNKIFRVSLNSVSDRLTECMSRLAECTKESAELKRRLDALE